MSDKQRQIAEDTIADAASHSPSQANKPSDAYPPPGTFASNRAGLYSHSSPASLVADSAHCAPATASIGPVGQPGAASPRSPSGNQLSSHHATDPTHGCKGVEEQRPRAHGGTERSPLSPAQLASSGRGPSSNLRCQFALGERRYSWPD